MTSGQLGLSSIQQHEISVEYRKITSSTRKGTILHGFFEIFLFESNSCTVWVESFINSEQRLGKLTLCILSVCHFQQFKKTSILATLPTIIMSRFIIKCNEFADELKSVEHCTYCTKYHFNFRWSKSLRCLAYWHEILLKDGVSHWMLKHHLFQFFENADNCCFFLRKRKIVPRMAR